MVAVPNAKLVDMEITNYARADRMLIDCTIGVRYETTLQQIEWLVERIRAGLREHPKVEQDENLPRVLPEGCDAFIDTASWQWPAVFSWLQDQGNVATTEMYRTFNCGVGMVVCVAENDVETALGELSGNGVTAWRLGEIRQGSGEVVLSP